MHEKRLCDSAILVGVVRFIFFGLWGRADKPRTARVSSDFYVHHGFAYANPNSHTECNPYGFTDSAIRFAADCSYYCRRTSILSD